MSLHRQSLTLDLLQAREAAMKFFRPSLNEHCLTEQQWRVIRILHQQGEIEMNRLADLACILKPSMTGVLSRMETLGLAGRRKVSHDQRLVLVFLTDAGLACFEAMIGCMERNYQHLQAQFGEARLQELLALLGDLRALRHRAGV